MQPFPNMQFLSQCGFVTNRIRDMICFQHNLTKDLLCGQWRAVVFLLREAAVANKRTDSNQLTKIYATY
jgi:hypothetical protein